MHGADVAISAVAGELLVPAIITFLAYLLAFVLGVVVTILLLIYELVREERSKEPGAKAKRNSPGFSIRLDQNSSSYSTTISISSEPKI